MDTAAIVKKWRNLRRQLRAHKALYLFMLPALTAVVIFKYMPMYGVSMAFLDVPLGRRISEGTWVGLKHFIRFFNTSYFSIVIKNTVTISLAANFLTIPLPIIFALMLHNCKHKRLKKAAQTATYLPYLMSAVIVVSIINLFCNGSTGLINIIRSSAGYSKISFFGREDMVIPLYVISDIWKSLGYSAIIYVSALSAVDSELVEAAMIDGASKIKRIIHIDIPAIAHTIIIMLIINMGYIFSLGTEKILLLQTDLNLNASETIGTYVYKTGILSAQYGFSTAVELFNTVICFILLLVTNFIARRVSDSHLF